jgi:hypothetical protein
MVATVVAPRLTAAQVILMAADDLMTGGSREFTEWELTVASWNRDKARFGLRGYDQAYPDHKRVMMEIMGKKPQNPVTLGLMEKVRPNTYRLTALGQAEAARLRSGGTARAAMSNAKTDLYRTAANLVHHPVFVQWKNDPDQPRKWTEVIPFLALGGDPQTDPAGCLAALRRSVRAGIDWCMTHDVVYLTPTVRSAGEAIHVKELHEVINFLEVLGYRFERQLAGRRT